MGAVLTSPCGASRADVAVEALQCLDALGVAAGVETGAVACMPQVLAGLGLHGQRCAKVAAAALRILWSLSYHDAHAGPLLAAVPGVVAALEAHGSVQDVVWAGLETLNNLAACREHRGALAAAAPLALACLRRHAGVSGQGLVVAGVSFLTWLARDGPGAPALGALCKAGAVPVVQQCLGLADRWFQQQRRQQQQQRQQRQQQCKHASLGAVCGAACDPCAGPCGHSGEGAVGEDMRALACLGGELLGALGQQPEAVLVYA